MRRLTHRLSMRWLYPRPPERLRPEVREALAQDREFDRGSGLLQRFRAVSAASNVERLDSWLAEARTAALSTCVAFAGGIQTDRAAVGAALRLPWPHGSSAGLVNRSTLSKRQG